MARGSTSSQGRVARSELRAEGARAGGGGYETPVKKGSTIEGVKVPFGIETPNKYLTETVQGVNYLSMVQNAWTIRELKIDRVYSPTWREYQFSTSERMGTAIWKAEQKYKKIYKALEPKMEALKKEVDEAIWRENSGGEKVNPELKKRYYDVYTAYTIAYDRFLQADEMGDRLRDSVSGVTQEGISGFYAKSWIDDELVKEIKRSIPKEKRERSFTPYER